MLNKVRIIPLGGLGEIGKNMTVFETENDMIIVDCGSTFPENEMLGVDLVIPDMNYVFNNRHKLRGVFITHAHEDHIGALQYLLKEVKPTVYSTNLTLSIVKIKLKENNLKKQIRIKAIAPRQSVILGDFKVEFITVNHSIPGAVAFAITTPAGVIVHTGDFKIDMTPTYGKPIDLARFGEYGISGVKLLMCESTNAEIPGSTKSELLIKESIHDLFIKYADKRIIITTFASNTYRLRSIAATAIGQNRKIVLAGRSMLNISGIAIEQGVLDIPEGCLITADEAEKYDKKEICIIATGSQGEPMSALYRMAQDDRRTLFIDKGDIVILSSHTIPGNEKLVNEVLNKLAEKSIPVITSSNTSNIHASGHACQDELKIMQSILSPEYLMPIHGEFKHLKANAELAKQLGSPENKIIIASNGSVVEMDDEGVRLTKEKINIKDILIDSNKISELGPILLRDRQILATSGILMAVIIATFNNRYILLKEPEIVSKGFIYINEDEEFLIGIKKVITEAFNRNENAHEAKTIEDEIRRSMIDYIVAQRGKHPMIIPVLQII